MKLTTPATASAPYTAAAPPVRTSTCLINEAGMELTSTELRKLKGTARVPSISTKVRLWPRLRRSNTWAPKESLPCAASRTPPASCGSSVEKSRMVNAFSSLICSRDVESTGLVEVIPVRGMREPVTTTSLTEEAEPWVGAAA